MKRYLYALVVLSVVALISPALAEQYPAPNPPVLHPTTRYAPRAIERVPAPGTPFLEWTWHKTDDGAHPDGNEQQLVWLMNRARSNPAQEGIWLAALSDPGVAFACNYFNVNKTLLAQEFAALPSMPPAAFDSRLYAAALAHANDQIARDVQDHQGQGQRIDDQGYLYQGYRLCVYSYAQSALYAHAGFNIDWGPAPDGMQADRGHRKAIMSSDGNYMNVGIAMLRDTVPGARIGPYVVAGDYVYAQETPTEYNRFIVGTVWRDGNGNGMYDPGEGVAGVTVMPDAGTYYAVTGAAGGFAIPVAITKPSTLTFTGGDIGGLIVKSVSIGAKSLLVDVPLADASVSYTIAASAGDGGSVSPSGSILVNMGASQTFTITPASGYAIADVLVDGASVGAVGSYTFSGVSTNHAISARFIPCPADAITTDTGQESPVSGQGMTFQSTLEAQDSTSYKWTFGDGTTASSPTDRPIDHTYDDVGTYTVTCSAVDASGRPLTTSVSTVLVTSGRIEVAPYQPAQGAPARKTDETMTDMAASDLRAAYAIQDETIAPLRPVSRFTAQTGAGLQTVVFRFPVYSIGVNVSSFRLYKLKDDGTNARYEYGSSADLDREGTWWICDAHNNDVPQTAQLDQGTKYYVNFVVKDNGAFDLDKREGVIVDPVSLVSTRQTATAETSTAQPQTQSGTTDGGGAVVGGGGGGGGGSSGGGSGGGCVASPGLPDAAILGLLLVAGLARLGRVFKAAGGSAPAPRQRG